jgi:predicted HTH transcriptional regulator
MTIRELRFLISQGEGSTLEFKKKAAHPEKIVREIVAFANASGGHLLIGVDDSGQVSGLKCAQEEAYVLEAAIARYCKPAIDFRMEYIPLSENKGVLSYHIFESPVKPHAVMEHSSSQPATVYVRVADKSIKASREVKEILRRRRKERDVKFHYGQKEQVLLKYLAEHPRITLSEFCQIANLNRYKASRTLVILVLANVLEIFPQEKEDYYMLKEGGAG